MRHILTAILSLALGAAAFAQDGKEAAALYVPTGGAAGAAGKVVYPSGAEAPVLLGIGSIAPSECPDGWFWVQNNVSLVSCADGTAYRFVPLTGDNPAYSNALGLEAIKGPPFGTDDGGPFMGGEDKGSQQ